MVQKIKAELVKNLRAELKKAKNPKKKEFSRREALEELKPVVAELRERGFSFEQIAELITQKSTNLLKASNKDLSSLFKVKDKKNYHDKEKSLHPMNGDTKADTPAFIDEI